MIVIQIIYPHPETLLHTLLQNNYTFWDVKKETNKTWKISMSAQDVQTFIEDVNRLQMSKYIKIVRISGPFHAFIKWLCRTEFIVSVGVCILFLFFLMNIIWKVEINGVSPETAYKIKPILVKHQLQEGKFIWQLENSSLIEEQLLKHVPNLLSVQIKKQGANYTVEAVEKSKTIVDNALHTKQMVASKSGVIDHMFIQEGFPAVKKHERVKKGDVLITNETVHPNEKDTVKFSNVKGKVYAETWYEIELKQPQSTLFKQIKEKK